MTLIYNVQTKIDACKGIEVHFSNRGRSFSFSLPYPLIKDNLSLALKDIVFCGANEGIRPGTTFIREVKTSLTNLLKGN